MIAQVFVTSTHSKFQLYPVCPNYFLQGLIAVFGGLMLYLCRISFPTVFSLLVAISQHYHLHVALLALTIDPLARNINKIVRMAVQEMSA